MNKVMLIGRLGQDPEMRVTVSGKEVTKFSLATSERWLDKTSNEWRENTEWHRIVVWGRQAKSCSEFLSKGKMVFVEGRIQSRDYEDQDGNRRKTSEIIAVNVVFLGKDSTKSGENQPDGSLSSVEIPEQPDDTDIPF